MLQPGPSFFLCKVLGPRGVAHGTGVSAQTMAGVAEGQVPGPKFMELLGGAGYARKQGFCVDGIAPIWDDQCPLQTGGALHFHEFFKGRGGM